MASITRILETEQDNYDHIHLFREGMFYKAHQHSAFLFHTLVKNFKTVKKYYKATGCEVVMLGFPSGMLDGLFPDKSLMEEIEDGHICFPCSPLADPDAYGQWFDSVPLAPVKKKEPKQNGFQEAYHFNFDAPEVSAVGDIQSNILRELETFDVGNATPIECMVLIGKLKSDLRRGASGGV